MVRGVGRNGKPIRSRSGQMMIWSGRDPFDCAPGRPTGPRRAVVGGADSGRTRPRSKGWQRYASCCSQTRYTKSTWPRRHFSISTLRLRDWETGGSLVQQRSSPNNWILAHTVSVNTRRRGAWRGGRQGIPRPV